MTQIPSGTKFVGINPSINTQEKKSTLSNSYSEIYTIEDILSGAKDPAMFWADRFNITGPIKANILLPDNCAVETQGPLSMASGYSITVPLNTTLTIL